MSRIDEALARAGSRQAEPVLPVVPAGGCGRRRSRRSLTHGRAARAGGPGRSRRERHRGPAAPPTGRRTSRDRSRRRLRTRRCRRSSRQRRRPDVDRAVSPRRWPVCYLAQAEHGTRVVMVTSAMPGEGKTLTAANLALTLAESYKRRCCSSTPTCAGPSVHEMFQVPNLSGLNDGLRSAEDHKIPLLRLTDHLSILHGGPADADPMSVLTSDRMRRVLAGSAARVRLGDHRHAAGRRC